MVVQLGADPGQLPMLHDACVFREPTLPVGAPPDARLAALIVNHLHEGLAAADRRSLLCLQSARALEAI